ncbi:hypothetical protein C8Q70DRAFT_461265 [Cubamyces menziesii]|nr:hypothetical protein C8Q70DRAFT_461265 [Cubamyces menziesii]
MGRSRAGTAKLYTHVRFDRPWAIWDRPSRRSKAGHVALGQTLIVDSARHGRWVGVCAQPSCSDLNNTSNYGTAPPSRRSQASKSPRGDSRLPTNRLHREARTRSRSHTESPLVPQVVYSVHDARIPIPYMRAMGGASTCPPHACLRLQTSSNVLPGAQVLGPYGALPQPSDVPGPPGRWGIKHGYMYIDRTLALDWIIAYYNSYFASLGRGHTTLSLTRSVQSAKRSCNGQIEAKNTVNTGNI